MSEWKVTYGVRLCVSVRDILETLPEEVQKRVHVIPCGKYMAPVVDIVSDERFEVFGELAPACQKGQELPWIPIPVK